jgi:hypothetical protein
MRFDVPGKADKPSEQVTDKWNERIRQSYDSLTKSYGASRFIRLDGSELEDPARAPMKWFGEPMQPRRCIGDEWTQKLADWGDAGRRGLHHEYVEYAIIRRRDSQGRLRPKRVQVTTELREYWLCAAMHDPFQLRRMAQEILGFQPAWEMLYGVKDPFTLSLKQREIAFSTHTAGHGNDSGLIKIKVPAQPIGKLNTEQALFMKSPINGLDDLMYIAVFGARPFAVRTAEGVRPATRDEILHAYKVEYLACHHADPNVVMGGHKAAIEGRTVAFDNPVGIYLRSFAKDLFRFRDAPVPDRWVRFGRGQPGMYQRLEFGPGDEEDCYLDDIALVTGANAEPLTGGYQLLRHLEIGPLLLISGPSPVKEDEYVLIKSDTDPIDCVQSSDCQSFRKLIEKYEAENLPVEGGKR